MEFNFSYDIAAIFFLLIFVWQYFSQRQFPLLSNQYYAALLLIALGNLLLDVFGTMVLYPLGRYPLWLCYTLNILYYVDELLLPSALAVYLLALSDVAAPKPVLITLIPSIVSELIFAVGMCMGLVFRIDAETGYTYGPLASITYVCAAINILITMVILWRYRARLRTQEKQSVLLVVLVLIFCAMLQFYNPSVLTTGMGMSVAIAIMYFNIQNPDRMRDETTGLFNSTALQLYFRSLLVRRKHFHVAATRIHGLHRVNTVYGVAEADRMLKNFGDYLNSCKEIWAFRMGSSRFAVLSRDEKAFKAFLYDINAAQARGMNKQLGLSLCYILPCKELKSPADAMVILESVLSSPTVSQQQTPYWVVTPGELSSLHREADVENELREAIPLQRGFELYCQPIYRTGEQRFDSGEILLRFRTENLGRLSPNEFITVAENNSLASPLDRMVVHMAFDAVAGGAFDGLGFHHIQINLSTATLMDEDAVDDIIAYGQEKGVDPAFILFEITETAAAFSEILTLSCIEKLRTAGFRFALDDFGTGYSTITRLVELPFCMVKLDRSLLTFAPMLFTKVVSFFDYLDVELVAEGVEEDEQVSFVSEAGIPLIQGYRFAKPMPLSELPGFINS